MATIEGRRVAGVVLAAGLLLAGCGGGSDNNDDPQAGPTADPTAGALSGDGAGTADNSAAAAAAAAAGGKVVPGKSLYMVLKLKGWELDQAIRPIGKGRAQQSDKSLDWTASYDEPDNDQSVILNGHLRGLAGQTAVLRKQGGGSVKTGQINGRQAAWVDQIGGNVVVLLALSPTYTVELVAEGIELEAALAIARALAPADETAWKAAGGRAIDCLATGDACVS